MTNTFRSQIVMSVANTAPQLNTCDLFDLNYIESKDSAIDQFLLRIGELNKIISCPNNFSPLLGQLILLGSIAAVESYFRTTFRRLIAFDSICNKSVHRRDIPYGAALHLTEDMLPEAVLERISFTSRMNITESIRDLIGIKGELPTDVSVTIDDFARICHLRHCAVHRFGKLGTINAIALGLDDHKDLLEKPLILTYESLQICLAVSTALVKTINNFLFNAVISRVSEDSWHFQYSKDKKLFSSYYHLFADSISVSGKSPELRTAYENYISQRKKHISSKP